jgi:hypothetical protein
VNYREQKKSSSSCSNVSRGAAGFTRLHHLEAGRKVREGASITCYSS